ncbi:hypothetical protein JRO89_XS05G0260600 [Xanthoceras sorbifolium]|uniref:Wall-associated receptor kinase galacturonan-binding domain-containing protein n=1 Tax=Xanthoceras sorbifolium TaxID=99658 RepID=A0ABQ8I3M0_9ROSI|nr:hypothetical protein JRO89_XS05G0260600 [Xanthoceras sorbifolium]
MALASYLVFFLVSYQLLLSLSELDPNPRCPPFRCGGLNIGFPFSNHTHPECGLFVVDNCNEGSFPKIQLVKNESSFYVKDISQDNTLWLQDNPSPNQFYNCSCKLFRNLTLPSSPFISFDIPINKTLFRCPRTLHGVPKNYSFFCNDSTHSFISRNESNCFSIHDKHPNNSLRSPLPQCSPFQLKMTRTQQYVVFNNVHTGFFSLQVNVTKECYECHWKQGQCKSDCRGNFYCSNAKTGVKGIRTRTWMRKCFGFCVSLFYILVVCSKVLRDPKLPLKLGLGSAQGRDAIKVTVAATATGIGILIIILTFCFRKKISSDISMAFWRKKTENYQNEMACCRERALGAWKHVFPHWVHEKRGLYGKKDGNGGFMVRTDDKSSLEMNYNKRNIYFGLL